MKIFIITEGGSFAGFGHVTRCISLYQAFEERGIQPFFIISGDGSIPGLLNGKAHEIFDWIREEQRLLSFIKNADMVIIDSYFAKYNVYEKISKLTEIPVYIDDNKRIDYPRGMVINGTVYAAELNYPNKKGVTYLLGSQYIPLRKEFWDVPEKPIRDKIEKVLITFGGEDARQMSRRVVGILSEKFPGLAKKVIIGKGFKDATQLESLKDKRTEVFHWPDAEGMKKAMLDSDIAICASGQTVYELARVGVSAIVIAVADNQLNNVKGWNKAGFIEYAGWWENGDTLDKVIPSIESLQSRNARHRKYCIGREFVDGQGAMRVVDTLLKEKYEGREA